MKAGDIVRLIGIPPDVHHTTDRDDGLQTRALFEKCLGKVFRIEGLDHPEGIERPRARLDVGHVLGKEPYLDTIWVESEYLEVVDPH
ncbi:MAG: hypothetical protein WCC21_01805 [Candidatus Acidiferrales bacterium]